MEKIVHLLTPLEKTILMNTKEDFPCVFHQYGVSFMVKAIGRIKEKSMPPSTKSKVDSFYIIGRKAKW